MFRIKLLARFIYYWDVLFTAIDNWQLAKYMKLREKLARDIATYNKNFINDVKMEDFKSWEDIK